MLGSALVDVLQSAGVHVRAAVRPTSDTRELRRRGVELVDDAARALTGVDAVYHVAGRVETASPFTTSSRDADAYHSANVASTEALVRAAVRAGVTRFVLTSSVAVYDLTAGSGPISEGAPLEARSEYGRSKAAAERAVLAHAADIQVAVVRPCIAYGPGDRHVVPFVTALARLPVLPLPDGGRHRLDLVHAADVATALYRAAAVDAPSGTAYNVASGAPVLLRELVEDVARALGKRPRLLPVPHVLLAAGAPVGRLYLRAFRTGGQELLSAHGVRLLTRDVVFDIERARSMLGFDPRPPRPAFAELVAA